MLLISQIWQEFQKILKKKKDIESVNVNNKISKKEETSMNSIGKYKRSLEPYKLSSTSKRKLNQCCEELQLIVNELLYYMDISVTEGTRSEKDQNKYYKQGTSRAKFGQSPHNYSPSYAIDIVPYPIPKTEDGNWDDNSPLWDDMAFLVSVISEDKDIDITWGGDFSTLVDKPHFELKNWKAKV